MPSRPPPRPVQQSLPLPPQPPCPAQIRAELVRMWQQRPYLHRRWQSVDAALACPERARRLWLCARQALLARQRTTRT